MVFPNWLGEFADRIKAQRPKRTNRKDKQHRRHEISAPVEVFEDRTLLASTPVVNLTSTPPSNIDEGDSFSISGTATHSGSESINVYVRWYGGTGTTSSSSSAYSDSAQISPGGSFSFWNQYNDDDQLTVSVWASVTDSGTTSTGTTTGGSTTTSGTTTSGTTTSGSTATGSQTLMSTPDSYSVTVDNVAPTLNVTNPTGSSISVLPYQPFTLSGNGSDVGVSDSLALSVNWGEGSSSQTTSINNSGSFSIGYSYEFPGTRNVTLTLSDDDGGSDAKSVQVNVLPDPAPVFSNLIWPTGPIDEGSQFQVKGRLNDNQYDDLTLTIHWGDSLDPSGSGIEVPVGQDFTATYSYYDDIMSGTGLGITYTITMTATDNAGNSTSVTHSLDVDNVDPTVTLDTFPDEVDVHEPFTISGTVSDQGAFDDLTVLLDWGDGSSLEAIYNLSDGDTFEASHQYLVRKAFTDYDVVVTVIDDNFGTSSVTEAVPDDPEVIALFDGITNYQVIDTFGATIVVTQSFGTVSGGNPGWQHSFRYLPYQPADGSTEFDVIQVAKIRKKLPNGNWGYFIPSPPGTDRANYYNEVNSNGYFVDVVPEDGEADGWSPFWSDTVGGNAASTDSNGYWEIGGSSDTPIAAANSTTRHTVNGVLEYHEMEWRFEAIIMQKPNDVEDYPEAYIGGISWGFSVAPDGSAATLGDSAINTMSDSFSDALSSFYSEKHPEE